MQATTSSRVLLRAVGPEHFADAIVGLPLEALDAGPGIRWLMPEGRGWRRGAFAGWECRDSILGVASTRVSPEGIEPTTAAWYGEIFDLVQRSGFTLARCWHTVPLINAESQGLEHYRAFSRGRHRAFEQRYASESWRQMPAASAVGSRDETLLIAFLACAGEVRHFENPRQVPAYRYPSEYGPRPPSFSRATRVHRPDGDLVLVSGTSAVRGHHSVHVGDVIGQTLETIANFASLGDAMGVPTLLGCAPGVARQVLLYLRKREDRERVEACLRETWLGPEDELTTVLADICRADLDVEIECSAWL